MMPRRFCFPRPRWAGKAGGLGALAFVLAAHVLSAADTNALRLWYRQPAAKWTEALPIGNGYLGAMVFGGTTNERVQFNEDTLWKGRPHDYVRSGAREQLAEIRRLILSGHANEAGLLAREKFLSDPVRQMPYQPFGDVHLEFPVGDPISDYRRELDLDTAVTTTSYRAGEVIFRREAFASYPDRVIVVHLTASQPGQINFTLRLDSPHKDSRTTTFADGTNGGELVLTGRLQPPTNLLHFEALVRLLHDGGEVTAQGNSLEVSHANAATLLLVARTSFVNFQDISGDPAKRCAADLEQLTGKSFADLRAAHVADYQRLFRRVALDLGHSAGGALPTDERLKRLKADGLAADLALAALHFQYGRYLLIASSRPGSQPANLQGVWNEDLNPPWESKYTLNINCEMNYWAAEAGNLSECHEPLFDLIGDLVVSGGRTAREQYGARGWVVHHNTDLWRGSAPINNIDGIWPTGGAWLCHHLWEHYLFTGDREFLRMRAYPAMKSAAQFFVDYLIKDPATGYLVTCPSHSPEQTPPDRPLLTRGPTMDNQLVRSLFTYTIAAAKILGEDHGFATELAGLRAQLPPNQVGRHGQLQEWLDDWDAPNNNHRHMSPLWGLYPGWDITPNDARVYAGAKVLLKWRGAGSTGWSYAWRMPLWARAGDGDVAFHQFEGLLQRRTLPNLFDLCGPFQIDGNFGASAGVIEMLLQSHLTEAQSAERGTQGDSETRILDLLPALPTAWPSGSVTGLKARDGFEVDLVWEKGALTKAVIRSQLGQPCKVRCGGHALELSTSPGGKYVLDGKLQVVK